MSIRPVLLDLNPQQEVNSKDPLLLLETKRIAEEKKVSRTQQGRKGKKRTCTMLELWDAISKGQDEAGHFLGVPCRAHVSQGATVEGGLHCASASHEEPVRLLRSTFRSLESPIRGRKTRALDNEPIFAV